MPHFSFVHVIHLQNFFCSKVTVIDFQQKCLMTQSVVNCFYSVIVMESQRSLSILLVLTVLMGCGWSQLFGTVPPRSMSDINIHVFYNKINFSF